MNRRSLVGFRAHVPPFVHPQLGPLPHHGRHDSRRCCPPLLCLAHPLVPKNYRRENKRDVPYLALTNSQALSRARALRSNNLLLLPTAWAARRDYFITAFNNNSYLAKVDDSNPMDPAGMDVMMDGLKKNFAMIIPQTLIMSWVSFFFSGFVLSIFPLFF